MFLEETGEGGVGDLDGVVEADLDLVGFAGCGNDFAFASQAGDFSESEPAGGPKTLTDPKLYDGSRSTAIKKLPNAVAPPKDKKKEPAA